MSFDITDHIWDDDQYGYDFSIDSFDTDYSHYEDFTSFWEDHLTNHAPNTPICFNSSPDFSKQMPFPIENPSQNSGFGEKASLFFDQQIRQGDTLMKTGGVVTALGFLTPVIPEGESLGALMVIGGAAQIGIGKAGNFILTHMEKD